MPARRSLPGPGAGRSRRSLSGSGEGGSSRSGVTLLEILTVVIIFSIMLGIVAVFMRNANRDLGVSVAANHATNSLRLAHQQSRSSGAPSWVVLDAKQNQIYLLLQETVGEWHLEDLNGGTTTGAFKKDAKATGGQLQPGRVGKGMQLSASASIACGDVPVYANDQGFSVEFWFTRHSGRTKGVLATIGDLVELSAESDGHVEARAGTARVTSGAIKLPLDAWCFLQLVHSGRELKLLLNRREVSTPAPSRLDWGHAAPLVIGGSGFTGMVDEIRLGLLVPREAYYFQSECTFTFMAGVKPLEPTGEVVIAFDAEGRLDAAMTPQPFRFYVRSPADWKVIEVGSGGTLQPPSISPEKQLLELGVKPSPTPP